MNDAVPLINLWPAATQMGLQIIEAPLGMGEVFLAPDMRLDRARGAGPICIATPRKTTRDPGGWPRHQFGAGTIGVWYGASPT